MKTTWQSQRLARANLPLGADLVLGKLSARTGRQHLRRDLALDLAKCRFVASWCPL